MGIKDIKSTIWAGLSAFLITIMLANAHAHAENINIVAFGDSLMAGYQLAESDAYPVRLAAELKTRGYQINMSNASVSGDTTSGGLSRLDWSIPDGTDAVILGLGANDALRGIPLDKTKANLDAMLVRLKERNIEVIMMGMLAPPNMGRDYETEFNAIYPALSEKFDVALYPFFLDGVAAEPSLNLSDGIHPNPDGISILVESTLPAFEEFLSTINR